MKKNGFFFVLCAAVCVVFGFGQDEGDNGGEGFFESLDLELHGFWEIRSGYRVSNDRHEKDMSLNETRLQTDLSSWQDWGQLKFKGDLVGDLVLEKAEYDVREAYVFTSPLDFMDMWIGRQILTWGTGDLIFINDLFPKDWQSFFIGRDSEYLKAPSDAVKASFFSEAANLDIVYTPQFDPDRYIKGERLSYWNGNLGRRAGTDAEVSADIPNAWFKDDEIAARLYQTIGGNEVAFYAYRGFWKSPGGQNANGRAIFPGLNVYGASVRGNVLKGIGNAEFGYYQSLDDESGENPLINNSELRFLAGYTQEIAKNLTAGLQYYIEHMLDYDAYVRSLAGAPTRDETRHLVTLRLTKLSEDQKLRLGVFTYYSPTDQDVHIRPNVHYKVSDNLAWEMGANIFFGSYPQSFFGQFQDNSNIYTGIRYSF